jgi:hypothetical protein
VEFITLSSITYKQDLCQTLRLSKWLEYRIVLVGNGAKLTLGVKYALVLSVRRGLENKKALLRGLF